MKKFIDGERAYPIYCFSARWSQDGEWDPKYPNEHKGLTEGRRWNSTSFYKMYKIERSQEQLDKSIKTWCFGVSEILNRNDNIANHSGIIIDNVVGDC